VLDPKVLMTIKDLPLLAKTVIDGFMNGFNKSTVKGPGLEFSQYRSYQPGMICAGWTGACLPAVTGTTSANRKLKPVYPCRFLVDASASMNHDDNGIKK
jgi:hypothetical protein